MTNRHALSGWAWVVLGLIAAAPAQVTAAPPLMARVYFTGTTRLAGNTNAAALRELLGLRSSVELREKLLDRFSRPPESWWAAGAFGESAEAGGRLAGTTPGIALPGAASIPTKLRPLFEDVLGAETWLELRGWTNRISDWTLAVRVPAARSGLWESNLWQLASAWAGQPPKPIAVETGTGWEVARVGNGLRLRWVQARGWQILSGSQGASATALAWQQQIQQSGVPWVKAPVNWLEADLDAGQVLRWFCPGLARGLAPAAMPPIRLTMTGQGGKVRTRGQIELPEAMTWRPEPWRIPTNILHDPLVSFTAIQGFAPWLGQSKLARELGLNPIPNQFYAWSYGELAFQSFMAVPAANITNQFEQLARSLPGLVTRDLANTRIGKFIRATNRLELQWQGLPVLVPFLRTWKESAGDYLLGGVFHPFRRTNAPPAELLAQVQGRTNLLYYNWELTQERVLEWRNLVQLLTILNKKTPARSAQTPAPLMLALWLNDIAPKLGNTITEITRVSPRELALVRTSQAGLTGLELVWLSQLLEEPAFPWGRPALTAAPAVKR